MNSLCENPEIHKQNIFDRQSKCQKNIYPSWQDIDMLVGGYVIVFVYVLVMLGRWDCVEQKVYLSMGGILGVMMGIVVSVRVQGWVQGYLLRISEL